MYRPSGCNNVIKGWMRAFVRLWRMVCIIVTRIRRPNARIITAGCDIFMVRSAKIPTGVPRKRTSVYESGRRSDAWVKFKITKSQEFVIGLTGGTLR